MELRVGIWVGLERLDPAGCAARGVGAFTHRLGFLVLDQGAHGAAPGVFRTSRATFSCLAAKQTMPQIPVCVGRLKAEPLRAGYRSLGNPPSHNSRTSLAARRLVVTTLLGSTKTWGVVALAKFGAHRPGQTLVLYGELCVDAGLVAARILAVPGAFQIYRDQAMQHRTLTVVGEPLVAQPRWDALAAQKRGQQV